MDKTKRTPTYDYCPMCGAGTGQTYVGYVGRNMNKAWCSRCGWTGYAYECVEEKKGG